MKNPFLLSLGLLIAGAVTSSAVVTFGGLSDANINDLKPFAFVAEARAGDLGAAAQNEFKLVFDTALSGDERNFAWGQNQRIGFSLSFVEATDLVTFTVDGLAPMTLLAAGPVNALAIRSAGAASRGTMEVIVDSINGSGPVGSVASGTGVEYLGIGDILDASGDFSLTGAFLMDWDGSQTPKGSRPAAQIHGFYQPVVPEPSTIIGGLAAVLVGLGIVRRRIRSRR